MKVVSEQSIAVAAEPFAFGRDQLRVLTCGSADDGKSTLIGRAVNRGVGHGLCRVDVEKKIWTAVAVDKLEALRN